MTITSELARELRILVSALAAKTLVSGLDNSVKSKLMKSPEVAGTVLAIAQTFSKPELTRLLNLTRSSNAENVPLKLDFQGTQVSYQGQVIGQTKILFKSPLPGELQARLAIESTIDRFLEYLQKVYQIVVLDESDRHVQLFVPNQTDSCKTNFEELWKEFLENVVFSIYGFQRHQLPGLIQTFIASINTLKLAKRESGGFGIVQIPVITYDQADIMAAWYYAIILGRLHQSKLDESQVKKLTELEQKHKIPLQRISVWVNKFCDTGIKQISPTTANINKLISELPKLLDLQALDPLPLPLLTENIPVSTNRKPADDTGYFCYSCGTAINKDEKKWETLRLTFESSTQRLQSSSTEKQPRICSSCSVFSFACPIKFSHRNIVIRLSSKLNEIISKIKIKDYLRLLVNKEVGISSGEYLMLPSESIIQKKERVYVADKLGKIQYALLKIASIFPLEVLRDFEFHLMTNQSSDPIFLEGRHLIFSKGLLDVYSQTTIVSGDKGQKEINLRLGDAIRYIQQDLPCLADYTITKHSNFSNGLEMEKIRSLYWESIEEELKLRRDSMNSNTQLAKRAKLYRDVASLTGLTWAFAGSMEDKLKAKDKDEREREISKLIEQVEDANFFCYYATLGVETTVKAKLWRNPDNHFVYEQTKWLLKELGLIDRELTDDAGKTWLQLYADDIIRAYTYFAENGYSSDKEWKELTYQLKLSLYTRFPELVRKLKTTGDK